MVNDIEKAEVESGSSSLRAMQRFLVLTKKYYTRDRNNTVMADVISGSLYERYPESFDYGGAYAQSLVIADTIEISAQALSEELGAKPSFRAVSKNVGKDVENRRATVRTNILNSYWASSDAGANLFTAAKKYGLFGSMVIKVEADFDAKMPRLRFVDPRLTYFDKDGFGQNVAFYQKLDVSIEDLCRIFPDFESKLKNAQTRSAYSSTNNTQVVFYQDKNVERILFFVGANTKDSFTIFEAENLAGELTYNEARIPGEFDRPSGGLYDKMVVPLLAKNSLTLDALKTSKDAANAPLVIPDDVDGDLNFGPNSVIRTNNPGGVVRVPNQSNNIPLQMSQQLNSELVSGSRIPPTYSGNSSASVVTGAGVEALNNGFQTAQLQSHQAQVGPLLAWALSLMLRMDEKLWPNEEKEINGSNEQSDFYLKYTPGKDINGDYNVKYEYGLKSGLNPQQFIVAGLQLTQGGVWSKRSFMDNAPWQIDPDAEEALITKEGVEQALQAAVQQMVGGLPGMLIQQPDMGQQIISFVSTYSESIAKGSDIISAFNKANDAMNKAQQAAAEAQQQQQAAQQASAAPQDPSAALSGGGAESGTLAKLMGRINQSGDVSSSVGFQTQRAV